MEQREHMITQDELREILWRCVRNIRNAGKPSDDEDELIVFETDKLQAIMHGVLVNYLEPANQLLRSAYQIASRNGESVAWKAFANQLEDELKREHKILHPETPQHTKEIE